jgi:thioredoxin-disulfide reductase
MSAPFVGKRVKVCGTSRDELNGSQGVAGEYDRDKGRYNVRLNSGQVVALKPANLELVPGAAEESSTKTGAPASSSSSSSSTWQTLVLVGLGVAFLYGQLGGGLGSGSAATGLFNGDEETEYDDRDEGYLSGKVREVTTLDQLRGALAHHSDNTGLPVVVDFFSHSCGPCRMIAPTFKKLASEYKRKVVFLKVDVNRNHEASSACGVRGMPTFQFYINKKKVFQFSGADERGLRHSTADVAEKTEDAGTYVGQEVTSDALHKFYEANDPSKASEATNLAEKYAQKTALLMRVCRQKYSKAPEASARADMDNKADHDTRRKQSKSGKTKPLMERSLEELHTELQQLRAEFKRRGAEFKAPEESQEEEESDIKFLASDDLAKEEVQKVVIVGGGPAGLSAAIYAARAGLKPLVLAPSFGGQLLGKGVDVENYPGVMGEHATGRGLVELMRQQAAGFETRFMDTAVLGVNFEDRPFRIQVNGTTQDVLTQTVILASGAESRWLQVDGEHEYRGRGVSACATCDGFLFRDKEVVVIGGGDTAMEDALHLARTSSHVTVIHRRDSFRASRVLAERVLSQKSINVKWNSTVQSFHGGDELTHITVLPQGGRSEKLKVSAAFVAIGHDPQTTFLRGHVDLDSAGYVKLKHGAATSVPGVFAAGDIADHTYRQAITASGTGAMAALDAERFLNELG